MMMINYYYLIQLVIFVLLAALSQTWDVKGYCLVCSCASHIQSNLENIFFLLIIDDLS